MTQPQYREWCPFCGNVQEPLDVLARHLDTCEAHAEYRALAGMPDYAARIAELEAQLQYQTRVNGELKEALDQALARCAELEASYVNLETTCSVLAEYVDEYLAKWSAACDMLEAHGINPDTGAEVKP
jgi:hypothetical protein